MSDSPEMKVWKAKEHGFTIGVMSMCAGMLMMLFVGHQLDVFEEVVFNEDGPPWKVLVTAAMMTLPYKAAKRWGMGKKPDGA